MDTDYEKTFKLCLIYSNDLKNILLRKVDGNKLDGLVIKCPKKGIEEVELSRLLNKELKVEIPPSRWQIVTTLQNIDKKWKIDVFITACDINSISKEGFSVFPTNDLPENCHPNLKWIIPMTLDLTVLGSGFNQILMK